MNSDVQGNPRIPESQLRLKQKEGKVWQALVLLCQATGNTVSFYPHERHVPGIAFAVFARSPKASFGRRVTPGSRSLSPHGVGNCANSEHNSRHLLNVSARRAQIHARQTSWNLSLQCRLGVARTASPQTSPPTMQLGSDRTESNCDGLLASALSHPSCSRDSRQIRRLRQQSASRRNCAWERIAVNSRHSDAQVTSKILQRRAVRKAQTSKKGVSGGTVARTVAQAY